MKSSDNRKWIAVMFLAASLLFFIMGFMYPLLQTGFGLGPFTFQRDYVYLSSSFRYFFDKNERFIGLLLLFFTIIFPILKYIFLILTLAGRRFPRHHWVSTLLEIINKWAMLDVFIVAVLILNMKFDSNIIISKLEPGTTLFAISVVLLMSCSLVAGKLIALQKDMHK